MSEYVQVGNSGLFVHRVGLGPGRTTKRGWRLGGDHRPVDDSAT